MIVRDPQKKWLTPLSIPEGQSGKITVKHLHYKAQRPIMLSSDRVLLMRGDMRGATAVKYPFPTVWHELAEENAVWTTDLPCEIEQQRMLIESMTGNVLIGGLGIGLVTQILANMEGVSSVTVVEQSEDVVALVKPHISGASPIYVEVSELFKYLKRMASWRQTSEWQAQPHPEAPMFDWAMFDIWRHDGEWTLYTIVWPLRRLARQLGVPDEHIVNWNEDVMKGQVAMGLDSLLRGTQATASASASIGEALGEAVNDSRISETLRYWTMTPERAEKEQVPPLQKWFWKTFYAEGFDKRPEAARLLADEYVQTFGWERWEKRFNVTGRIPTGPGWKEHE